MLKKKHKADALNKVRSLSNSDKIIVRQYQSFSALKQMKLGKASGLDGLAAEHFIYANNIEYVL